MANNGQFGAGPVVPPGWYADPVNPNVLRYWTGSTWTDHAAPMPLAPTYARVPAGDLDGAPLSFGEAIVSAFRNMFRYQGRASRSAFWWFALFSYFAGTAGALLGGVRRAGNFANFGNSAGPVSLHNLPLPTWQASGLPALLYLALLLPSIALLVRRLHDRDTSGWLWLLALVPFGGLILAIMCIKQGTPGPNRYSLVPLSPL